MPKSNACTRGLPCAAGDWPRRCYAASKRKPALRGGGAGVGAGTWRAPPGGNRALRGHWLPLLRPIRSVRCHARQCYRAQPVLREGTHVNVLLIGGGGRGDAIPWKPRQSPRRTNPHVAPGNAGTAAIANTLDLPIPKTAAPRAEVEAYVGAVVTKARELRVDLVVVAPDDPLAWGPVDRLQAAGIPAFGPTRAAAEIESS